MWMDMQCGVTLYFPILPLIVVTDYRTLYIICEVDMECGATLHVTYYHSLSAVICECKDTTWIVHPYRLSIYMECEDRHEYRYGV